jgi:hypothetical protein
VKIRSIDVREEELKATQIKKAMVVWMRVLNWRKRALSTH